MEKNIQDYIHFYLGVKGKLSVRYHNGIEEQEVDAELNAVFNGDSHSFKCFDVDGKEWEHTMILPAKKFKPYLRPLSDMTEEEAKELVWLCMDNPHLKDKSYRIDKDEIQINVVPNDGGNMLDANIQVYIEIDCRCWTGNLAIWNDGAFILREEDSDRNEPIPDTADKVRYLLSKGFDLFNLVSDGLALDKTK